MEPIEYQVLTNLQAALQGIRIGNGYHYDVRGTAVKLDPNQDVESLIGGADAPRPFVLLEVLPERREYRPSLQIKITRPVTIHWVSESDPTRDSDRLQVFMRGCADVERAIVQDITRGGLAGDTRIEKTAFDAAVDGSQVWAQIDIEILMHRTYGQPDA